MQAKISIYEEILALEPGSKLFFPLAKMLAESGTYSRAEEVLVQGLKEHPEYFEARLLLLDVLDQTGQESVALEHVKLVLDLLGKHKGFWASWQKMFQANNDSDSRIALQFVEASLQGQSMTWADVFAKGVASLLGDQGKTSAPDAAAHVGGPDQKVSQETASELSAEDALSAGKGMDNSSLPVDAAEPSDLVDTIAEEAPLVSEDAKSAPEIFLEKDSEEPSLPVISEIPELTEIPEKAVVAAPPMSREETDSEKGFDDVEPADDADAEEVEDILLDQGVRTRTMADLLMRQEEYGQALAIYEGLWHESLPGSERNELKAAADQARSAMEQKDHVENGSDDVITQEAEGEETRGSEDALLTLTALADRLEKRAAE